MLQALQNAMRLPDLRRKILFTLFILVIYRVAAHIPAHMKPVLLDGMHGLGDNLHQRALIRHLLSMARQGLTVLKEPVQQIADALSTCAAASNTVKP